METDSLTYKTFKNISYNIVGYIWPMFFSLFITPIVIFKLGIKNYGIYLFINALMGLMSLLDLGFGTAVAKHMSFYWGKKDYSAIQALIRSANTLSLLIGALGAILLIAIGFFGPQILPAQFANYQAYSILFIIAGGLFFITTLFNTYTVALAVLQRFDISNKIGIISTTVSSLSVLIVVLSGGSLTSMLLTQLLFIILFNIITMRQVKKMLPQAGLKFGWDTTEIKNCYKFGLVVFINSIAGTALSSLDRLIIPFYVGPSNLTYYSVPGSVTSRIPGVASTLSVTMFPTTSQLDGGNNRAQIETLYVRSFRLITIAAAALTITSIAFAYKILLYWLSADFANHSTQILIILAFTNFFLALFGPLSSFLLGLNKVKFLTAMSVSMGILNAILLLILLPRYGITGAAWAYLLSLLPVIYIFYYTEKKYLTLSSRGHYYTKKILGTILVSALVWIIDVYLLSPIIVNVATLLLIGGSSVLIYIVLYKLFGFFDTTDWVDFERFFTVLSKKVRLQKI
ncbi:MAG: polysaccharide biosynthesis C-terminal domain-containing protein [bacterium]